jgi:hypothetical protein
VLLVIAKPFGNHNGGMIEFGPDGYLYIATGDGGDGDDPGNRAQNIEELLGKILRIDVDHEDQGLPYSVPPSNPFVGVAGRDEIYAYGLRNPWRFSFDRATGALYAGDVGQSAVEEINVVIRGGNYGWRIWEGTSCTGNDPELCTMSGFTFPIAQYAHTAERCSVTGGYVYRGAMGSVPAGAYVYGDFCSGEIFLFQNGATSTALDSGVSISSFGEDEAGEIHVVGLNGTLYRIVNAPTCTVSLTPTGQSVPVGGVQAAVIQVAAAAGCDWTASTTADWITITSGQTGSGDGQVVFDVSSNQASATTRRGIVTVAGVSFAVTQPGCTFTLGSKRRSVPVKGIQRAEVRVNARDGCEWSATSHASWITIRSGQAGSGDGRVAFDVASNFDSTSDRTGTLTIAGRTFTVVQAGCAFTLGTSVRTAPPGGTEGASVRVNTTAGCLWTATSNVAWITIVSGNSGAGDGQVVFDVAPNQGATARSGTLTIAGRTYTVKQAAP